MQTHGQVDVSASVREQPQRTQEAQKNVEAEDIGHATLAKCGRRKSLRRPIRAPYQRLDISAKHSQCPRCSCPDYFESISIG